MSYYLYLDDDLRRPPSVGANNVYPEQLRFLYRKELWCMISNYEQFVGIITRVGIPKYVSLDYDLGKGEKTGYDCCVWLVDYCNQNNLELPEIICHSWNSEGRNQIMDLVKAVRPISNTKCKPL
jgi:hypothetical protein